MRMASPAESKEERRDDMNNRRLDKQGPHHNDTSLTEEMQIFGLAEKKNHRGMSGRRGKRLRNASANSIGLALALCH